MRHLGISLLLAMTLSLGACVGGTPDDPDTAETDTDVDTDGHHTGECRQATVDPADAYAPRYEGDGFANACTEDADCMVSGCSGEVCAAESVFTTCEGIPLPSGTCGCVNDTCIWYETCP